jgi:hypothetical protein
MTAADIAQAYAGPFTPAAVAAAIDEEHRRGDELIADWHAELQRKKRDKRKADLVAVGLVAIFIVGALVWGRP